MCPDGVETEWPTVRQVPSIQIWKKTFPYLFSHVHISLEVSIHLNA